MFFIKAGSVIAWLAVVFGGIRLALGLVVAIPLTVLHSLLQSMARKQTQVLEEQSAGIVAQMAEK